MQANFPRTPFSPATGPNSYRIIYSVEKKKTAAKGILSNFSGHKPQKRGAERSNASQRPCM
jgi:hypothetical protein